MKIAIYGQFYHKNSGGYIASVLNALDKAQADVFIEANFLELIRANENIEKDYEAFETFTQLDDSYDLFFSIGGDGTILRSITYVKDLNIPIVGINTGRLGFLATIQKDDLKEHIDQILEGQYSISERSLLQVKTTPADAMDGVLNFALNEVAVNRKNTTSMIRVATELNGEYLTSYWSDGLIVATPTGSTGYSLSCGGPVIDPQSNSFVITPIAPHNLNARPFVIPDDTTIGLQVYGREDSYLLSLDSRIVTLSNDTEVEITRAPFTISLVQLNHDSFIKTIRQKLLWGEDKRNFKQ
ncbi:NAD kinase [Gilvibacter sp.]|uniref:NAD kinase n=1 Tax=Gilvibacter sp. TaxID=2729997 RepID=UPI003F4A0236